jgi:hypothetical protein
VIPVELETFTKGFEFGKAESKTTKQLERKRYWEEKARDARENHRYDIDAGHSYLNPRVVHASISKLSVGKIKNIPGTKMIAIRSKSSALPL